MPRGTPDGAVNKYLYAGQQSDVSAVYNFLWGWSPLDGLGRVSFLDTFNNGIGGWYTFATGTGSSVPAITSIKERDDKTIFSPPNCAALYPGVTSGARSLLGRKHMYGKSARLGVEAAVLYGYYAPNYRMVIDYYPVGGASYYGLLRFDRATGAWQIYTNDGGGTYQAFYTPGVFTITDVTLWLQIKLVCDFVTGKYVRALIGDQAFDISAYDMKKPGFYSGIAGYYYMEVGAESWGATSDTGHIGYILTTRDEP